MYSPALHTWTGHRRGREPGTIKIKWPKNNGISCQTAYGPIFGGGYDFHITEKSNINITLWKKFPTPVSLNNTFFAWPNVESPSYASIK